MCGIVACRLTSSAEHFLLSALRRMDNRAYDPASIATTRGLDDMVVSAWRGHRADHWHRLMAAPVAEAGPAGAVA